MRSPVAHRVIQAASPEPAASPQQASELVETPTKDDQSQASSTFGILQGMQRLNRGRKNSTPQAGTGNPDGGAPPPVPAAHSAQRPPRSSPAAANGDAEGGPAAKRAAKRKVAAFCYICRCMTDDWTSKAECRLCNNDKEAAKRDCVRQNQKNYFEELSKDKEALGAFVRSWVAEIGPSRGFGNIRGGFKFAVYRESLRKTTESVRGQEKVLKTKIEFRDAMVAKGMTPEWALREFDRRRSRPDIWEQDDDPDCSLPRVQMHGKTKREDNEINAKDQAVVAETSQQRNPTAAKFEALLQGFAETAGAAERAKTFELLREGKFADCTPEANASLVSNFSPRAFLEQLEEEHAKKVASAASSGSAEPPALQLSTENAENNQNGKQAFFDLGRFVADEKGKVDRTLTKLQQQLEKAREQLCSKCSYVLRIGALCCLSAFII